MAKLYPPGLAGTLPAFISLQQITIPYIPNKTIGNNENFISGFNLILRNVTNNTIVASAESSSYDFIKNEVIFNLTNFKNNFKIGRFYKAQLAYIDKDRTIGYYSTVGVIKYTAAPTLSISGLEPDYYNQSLLKYTGVYENKIDSTEKVYSYNFIIRDALGEVFASSGELIHNHSFDTALNESTDEFTCEKQMELNKNYYITYSVKTANGLICTSHSYPIRMLETEIYQGNIDLIVKFDEENAYMSIILDNSQGDPVTGNFSITRACSKDNYATWHEIYRIGFDSKIISSKEIMKDFTIEHGYGYKYGIQQYNKYGYYSKKASTDEVFAKFEHIYLFDGDRQLKIKYNPQISEMKLVKLETKQDTIGSKYPYIFRNGNVSYKEIPIKGLISYLSDEQELFLKDSVLFRETFQEINSNNEAPEDRFSQGYDINIKTSPRGTSLNDSNVKAEKIFRDEVLEFLNNGKFKVLKSPTEGNLIVYTMNVTLTPNPTVGRMLWEFDTTAYECMDYTYENLCNYNFLTWDIPLGGTDRLKTVMTNYLVDFYKTEMSNDNDKLVTNINNNFYLDISYGYDIYGVSIHNASPGTRYFIDGKEIIIGVSGQYSIDFGRKISSLKVIPTISSGYVTFRYRQETYNPFNIINGIYIEKLPIFKQLIGKHHITEELSNSLDILEDFNFIKFSRRVVYTLYVKKEDLAHEISEYNINKNLTEIFKDDAKQVFYQDLNCLNPFEQDNFIHSAIYEIKASEFNPITNTYNSTLVFYLSYDEKTYPRLDYYYETLTDQSKFSDYGNRKINVKWDWSNFWDIKENFIFESQEEYNSYILNPIYEKVALIPFKEKFQKVYYEPIGKISEEDCKKEIYYYYENGEYLKATLDSYSQDKDYYIAHFYLTRLIRDKVKTMFFEASDYKDYYLKKIENKIFIAPCQYDCKIFMGTMLPNGSNSTTENELKESIIDVSKDIVFSGVNISDIQVLNIGWGVICEFMYNEKRRLYGFENYNAIKSEINPNKAKEYVKYVNRLSDLIYFYSIGDSNNNQEGGNSNA